MAGLFIFSTAQRGCVPVAQTSTTCVAIWSFERQPHALIMSKFY